jgi:hypothetical protein
LPYKDPEDQREYAKAWYQANRDLTIERALKSNQRYRARNKQIVDDLKAATPCSDCKQFYAPHVMDFDHINDDKIDNISCMVRNSVSVETLRAEIAKTEICCSNCHRERTHKRRQTAV